MHSRASQGGSAAASLAPQLHAHVAPQRLVVVHPVQPLHAQVAVPFAVPEQKPALRVRATCTHRPYAAPAYVAARRRKASSNR